MIPTRGAKITAWGARLLREPLLHFLLLGVALFGLEWHLTAAGRERIVIDAVSVEQLVREREALALRALSPEEQRELVEAYVEDELLYREAYRRGLDRADGRMRRNLILKMRGLLVDEIPEPTEEALRDYYLANPERFVQPALLDLAHVLFLNASDIPENFLQALNDGADPAGYGVTLPGFARRLTGLSPQSLVRVFGEDGARRVLAVKDANWHGPLETARGFHFVRVVDRRPERQPSFEEARPYVEDAWLLAQSRSRLARELTELRKRYHIVLPPLPGAG